MSLPIGGSKAVPARRDRSPKRKRSSRRDETLRQLVECVQSSGAFHEGVFQERKIQSFQNGILSANVKRSRHAGTALQDASAFGHVSKTISPFRFWRKGPESLIKLELKLSGGATTVRLRLKPIRRTLRVQERGHNPNSNRTEFLKCRQKALRGWHCFRNHYRFPHRKFRNNRDCHLMSSKYHCSNHSISLAIRRAIAREIG